MKLTRLICVLFICFIMASCGGGGSAPPTSSNTLSGIAAVGYPIVGGTINVTCASGSTLNTTTSLTGAWQVTISGQTAPCAVQVNGGTINGISNTIPYYSIATNFGNVNITPLTNLLIANLASTATPNVWFSGLNPNSFVPITSAAINAAISKQCDALSGLTQLCVTNLISAEFTPTSYNMLIALQVAMINFNTSYASLLSNASASTYTAPAAGFNTALSAAFKATTAPITAIAINPAQNLKVNSSIPSFSPIFPIGGTAPYSYSYIGGTLPAGLSFSSTTGVVSGTPTEIYPTISLVFSVKDAKNAVASTNSIVSFTVFAASQPISAIANTTAQNLTEQTVMANFSPLTPSGGTMPYVYSYTGTLPTGLSFDPNTGVVSGTPTATFASANLVFSVKDANNVAASTTSTVSFTVDAAPAGSLDTTFNLTGKVLTDIKTSGDAAQAVAIQSDGKIVAAGSSSGSGSTGSDFALVRYNVDGSLDANFGTGGKVTTDFGTGLDIAKSIAIQADGKIVAAGYTNGAAVGGPFGLAMARYNTNGSLDTTFGTGGKVTTSLGTSDIANSIAIQSDGKIIVASTTAAGFGLARYNTNGSLDTTFGTAGKVTTAIYSVPGSDSLSAIVLQSDGKIVAVGAANPTFDFAVVRYNSNGSLDATFGVGGKVTTDMGGIDSGKAIAIQSDGKIVAAGTSASGSALVRYNTDGNLDTTFGTGGKVTTLTTGSLEVTYAVVIQGDGKVVTVGTGLIGGSSGVFSLARYNTNGGLDTTFDTDGKLTTSIGIGPNTLAYAAAIQSDGKIVAAGTANGDFALVRYLP